MTREGKCNWYEISVSTKVQWRWNICREEIKDHYKELLTDLES